ncbi:MAG: DUF3488 domain-containing protein [Candidatus Hydrogenedentes bacterium]|nr:DUF3488 domain-containing protein [Candidatus Hydrogenedentota bacterium]
MRKRVERSLRLSTALIVLAGYLALAVTPEYGAALLIVPAILLVLAPFGEWLDQRYPGYQRATTAITIVYTLIMPVSIIGFGLLDGVISLIIYILAFKLLHRKVERDYYHIFLMSFFLLVAACVQTPSASISLVFVLFLFSAAWSFLLLQVHVESLAADHTKLPDLVALRQTRWVPEVEVASRHGPSFSIIMGLISVASLLMTIVLFVMFPRMEAGILGRDSFALSSRTGLSASVDLATSTRIERDTTPVMRVEFPLERYQQYDGPMFWRSTTLDSYSRGRWERSPTVVDVEDALQSPILARILPYTATYIYFSNNTDYLKRRITGRGPRVVHQVVFLDVVSGQGIPTLNAVETFEYRGGRLEWDRKLDGSIIPIGISPGGLQYKADSLVEDPPAEVLREAPDNYEERLSPDVYQLLTYHDLEARTIALARDITESAETVYDKAVAIERWLQTGDLYYSLDLETRLQPTEHPVDIFLHNTKIGHCELFASAMALMLRSLGIPTRVVNGFRGAEWNGNDQSYLVRNEMAHLWVEVYFLGRGWVTFDPSPPSEGIANNALDSLSRWFSGRVLKAKILWYSRVIGFTQERRWQTFRDLALGIIGFGTDLSFQPGETRHGGESSLNLFRVISTGVLGITVLVGIVIAVPRLRVRRNHRRVLTRDQSRAIRLFGSLVKRLQRYGAECRGRTTAEILDELYQTPQLNPAPVERVFSAYNQVRFGGRALDWHEYRQLRRLVQSVRPQTV